MTTPINMTPQYLSTLSDEEIEALDLSEDVLDAIDFERYLSRATKESERFSS
jgi:hypothetical protein